MNFNQVFYSCYSKKKIILFVGGENLKKRLIKLFFIGLFVVLIFSLFVFIIFFERNNNKKKQELLNIANSIVKEDISNEVSLVDEVQVSEIFSSENIEDNNNVIGKLIISRFGIEAPIQDGVSQDVLKYAVGHFQTTSYWDGNVALASHNRGSYAHYFDKLNQLVVNDEIIYQTQLGSRAYLVSEIKEIEESNVSVLDDFEENRLTLITCITNKSNLRLCVIAKEK